MPILPPQPKRALLLKLAAAAMPALAVAMIVSGALRGTGDTHWPMSINMIGMMCVRIPGTYWGDGAILRMVASFSATRNDSVLIGAWCVVIVDISVRAMLVLFRFFHGGWKTTRV